MTLQYFNFIEAPGYISNISILQEAAKADGFINIFPDHDGFTRRAPLLMEYKGGLYPSLTLQTALTYLGAQVSLFTPTYNQSKKLEGIQIGSYLIPTDDKAEVLIPFDGRSYTFQYYSAVDVFVIKGTIINSLRFNHKSIT